MCRTPVDAAPLLQRVFAQYGIPVVLGRRVPFTHTPLGRALLALARCAWLADAPADALLSYLRSPGVAAHPEVVDGLELEVRQRAVGTAAEAREGLGWALAEIDSLRVATAPSDELAWQARRLFAAPHRAGAAQLSAGEELDARRSARCSARWPSSSELGETPTGAELIELLEDARGRAARRLPARRGPDRRPARRSGPGGSAPCSCAACRRASSRWPQRPSRSSPTSFAASSPPPAGCACARARTRCSRERYLFYTSVSRATERLVLATGARTRRGTWRCPRRSSPTCRSCSSTDWPDRRRRRMLADVVWRRRRPRPRASSPAPRRRRSRRSPASVPSPIGSLSEPALEHVRHRRILSAGALETLRRLPGAVADRARAPAGAARARPRSARPRRVHAQRDRAGAARLGDPVTPRLAAARARDPRRAARRPAAPDRAGRPAGVAGRGPQVDRGRPAPVPRPRGARTGSSGRHTASSSGSGSTRRRSRCRR